jgi:lipopolysaccharide transport system permease protein
LVSFLARRDITVRYRQTLLGAAWAVAQPLLTLAVFSVVFGRLARIPADGVPYPLFALCGLLPWLCFATALGANSNSLVGNTQLLSKVYFPRLVLPLASVAPALVDMCISLLALSALLGVYGVMPSPRWLILPLLLAWPVAVALSAGLWLSALSVEYRDVRHALPFLTQIWLFVSPVIYPASLFPERVRLLLGLNPMAACIETWRWAVLGTPGPSPAMLLLSVAVLLGLSIGGAFYFRRAERAFADVI